MKPDGAEWRSYQMPADWPNQRLVRSPRTAMLVHKRTPGEGPKVAHYLCFSLQCRVPLLPKFIVPLSEQFRSAANSHLCKIFGDGTPSFAIFGHKRPTDAEGDHQHAFYLPMAKRGDHSGCLSDLHIWCPYGFTQEEVNILLRISRLNWGGGKFPVRPVLTALSKEPPTDAPFSTGQIPAKLWRSASPFVPPRYFYRGGHGRVTLKEKDRPEWQLVECLRAIGVTTAGEIRRLPMPFSEDKADWDIVRTQEGEEPILGDAPTVAVHCNGSNASRGKERRVGMFFEIEFDKPVALKQPAFGHSCHFGLGLFIPA
jgi:CRISPR-associated protein Csb2